MTQFLEKPQGDGQWINGGYFRLRTVGRLSRIEGDDMPWESEPLESLARDGQLGVYQS